MRTGQLVFVTPWPPGLPFAPVLRPFRALFLGSVLALCFPWLRGSIFGRSEPDFVSQLGSQTLLKSHKNRCQEAVLLGLQFLIDFGSVFVPNLVPQNPTHQVPTAGRALFSKNRRSMLTSILGSILMPTCLHFPSQFSPKSS